MSPVRYKLGFYIPEDGILHSHRRENLKPYSMPQRFPSTSLSAVTFMLQACNAGYEILSATPPSLQLQILNCHWFFRELNAETCLT
jgi:hypothetical protein